MPHCSRNYFRLRYHKDQIAGLDQFSTRTRGNIVRGSAGPIILGHLVMHHPGKCTTRVRATYKSSDLDFWLRARVQDNVIESKP